MSRKRRKHGLAASVAAATPASATPVQAALQGSAEPRHYHNTYAQGRLWDRDGQPWRRVDEFVESQRALQLVRAGTPWLVEWCGGPLEWPTEQTADRLLDQLRGKLVSQDKARRLSVGGPTRRWSSPRSGKTSRAGRWWCSSRARRPRGPSPGSGKGVRWWR